MQPLVANHGKRLVGWEEIASAPLNDGAVVQHWRNADLARAAGELVMSPADRVYLDMKYDADTPLGLDWAGHVELRDSYDWDPAELAGEQAVLGVEAPLWTETITTLEQLETMLLPRLCAVAEVAWSPPCGARLGRLPGTGGRRGRAVGRGGGRVPPLAAGRLVSRSGPPVAAVPRPVEHRAVLAEPDDVEPVTAPRGDRRRAGEDPAEPFPVLRAG